MVRRGAQVIEGQITCLQEQCSESGSIPLAPLRSTPPSLLDLPQLLAEELEKRDLARLASPSCAAARPGRGRRTLHLPAHHGNLALLGAQLTAGPGCVDEAGPMQREPAR